MTLRVAIEGIGVLGPGLPDWETAAGVLSGRAPLVRARTVLPAPELLPSAERRRAGRVIRLALAVGLQAVRHSGRDARSLPSIFTSSGGDGENCNALCEALAEAQRMISPTRFHNSVHNAAAGYWSIACGCCEASTTLCAYDASFGAGLLEAAAQVSQEQRPVLLVAYDADYPPPLRAHRNIDDAFGLGLVLGPSDSARARSELTLAPSRRPAGRLDDPALESLRTSSPAARGLPLLESLAHARSGCLQLDYLDDCSLAVEIRA